jgi:hypothetical protein
MHPILAALRLPLRAEFVIMNRVTLPIPAHRTTVIFVVLFALGLFLEPRLAASTNNFFEIEVLDEQTGRGVPLVELETLNHVRFITDSAGRIAFNEPGLMGREVFFHVRSHGYEFPKDAFGFAGKRLVSRLGQRAVLRIKRLNVAERLYRVTGEGIYRDSVLLGYKPPIARPLLNGGVLGQDSVQSAIYGGKIYWFWGDTTLHNYPFGNFRMSGATSMLPERGGLNPLSGIDLNYFTNTNGFSREMCLLEEKEGVVWLQGVVTVPDETGRERMVAQYSRRQGLVGQLEQGIAVWNDEKQTFERAKKLELEQKWCFPYGLPFRWKEQGIEYVYIGNPFAYVRVRADLKSVLDPSAYEAWTCRDDTEDNPIREDAGALRYEWRAGAKPVTAEDEERWLNEGKIAPGELRYWPIDIETGKSVKIMTSGTGNSIRWNKHRQRWVMIGVEERGSSMLGEVWFSEANAPTGPWRRAKKILTHDKYTFYNPAHHEFFDQEDGRFLFFQGTYVNTFSGNPEATPRYDYNQIMYRLDLDDARLNGVKGDGP